MRIEHTLETDQFEKLLEHLRRSGSTLLLWSVHVEDKSLLPFGRKIIATCLFTGLKERFDMVTSRAESFSSTKIVGVKRR